MASRIEAMRAEQRAKGPASILAIGTANPPNVVDQLTYPDWYFRVTNSEHKTELKQKFQRICQNSKISKRHMYITEDLLKEYPDFCDRKAPTLNARMNIMIREVPKLGTEAAINALKEWGRPRSEITHVIFTSTTGATMPGADYQLVKLLGLPLTTKRLMFYQLGCYASGTALRVAKDITENNKDARVLIVSTQITVMIFRSPDENHIDDLIGQALFSDGAASMIVGADPLEGIEKPLFQMVSAAQILFPNSGAAIDGTVLDTGLVFHLDRKNPDIISDNIGKALSETLKPLGITDLNSLFWALHPGGKAILDQVEQKLKLNPAKLRLSRKVLTDYGNMSACSVVFILDEMRKEAACKGHVTTGEGLEWGILCGFGPGLTTEVIVLHSVSV